MGNAPKIVVCWSLGAVCCSSIGEAHRGEAPDPSGIDMFLARLKVAGLEVGEEIEKTILSRT
eukprot:964414-Amphidinium_carterae.1